METKELNAVHPGGGAHGGEPLPLPGKADALAAAFLAGALAQTSQLVLLRELLSAFSGLELTLGLALASWMLLVAAGGWIAETLLRFRPRPAGALASLLGFCAVPLVASALLARIAPQWLGIARGEIPGLGASLILCLIVLAPACLLAGGLFVAASRTLEEAGLKGRAGTAVGLAYLSESGGSAIAGALFSFVLAPLGSFPVLALACAFSSLAAAAWWIARCGRRGVAGATLALAAGAAGLALPLFLDARTAALSWAAGATADFVGYRDSRYGRILATRRGGQTDFFVSGHFAFSLPDREAAASLAHPVLSEHPAPRRVLLVGGTASGLVEEILKHGVERVDAVELDPALVEAAKEFAPSAAANLDDPRVRFHAGDGRAFVKRSPPGVYDVILSDVPDPETAGLNRYYTLEFFRELHAALAPGGIAAFTLSGAPNAQGEELLRRNATIYHTFLAAFPEVRVWPGDRFLYFGADRPGVLTLDPEALAARFRERAIRFPWVCRRCGPREHPGPGPCPACGEPLAESRWFTEHHFRMLLEWEDVERVNRELRRWPARSSGDGPVGSGGRQPLPDFMRGETAKKPAPWEEPVPAADRALNTDANPAATLDNLFLWNRIMGEGSWSRALHAVSGLGGWIWAILSAGLALPLLAAAARRGKTGPRRWPLRWGLAVSVGVLGFAVISLEMIVLLAFQSQYGYVVGEMGALFGAFMLGLGAGGWFSLRRLPHRSAAAGAVLVGSAAFAAALPFAIRALAGFSPPAALPAYLALAGLSGVPLGLLFPAAAELYAGREGEAGSTAAILYGADLLGGIAGALLVGPLLVPAMGIRGAALLEIVPLLLTGAAILAIGRRLSR